MDQELLRERERKCNQENPPGCTAGCPVHVDARGIMAAVRKEDYAAGFALLYRVVPFPRIISRICDQPCRQSCKRAEIDEAIAVREIEKICVDKNNKPPSRIVVHPLKNYKVAVVGAGLSSLTAAFELLRKGYKVVIYEGTDKLGGSVRNFPEDKLPEALIQEDLAVFDKMPVEIKYNTPVYDLKNLTEEYDAIYLGVGRGGGNNSARWNLELNDSGNIKTDSATLATSHPKVFAGGSLRRSGEKASPIFSLCDGRIAAVSIDRLLQNASLTANREKEGPFTSTLYTDIGGTIPQPVTLAADSAGGYTVEEALREAGRCLSCACLECVKVCEYLAHYRSYPKRYVREVYNNLSIVMGIHHANKMINSCSLCGLCEKVCPGKLNMGEIIREARQNMVKKGKMPPSAHDFALRDMKYSNSGHFFLNRHQPGFTNSRLAFYPGCQLAASSPRHVRKIYEFLCEKTEGGAGLMLGCCGAPAAWAGREDLFKETMRTFKTAWFEMGSPTLITACPTCHNLFKQEIPEMHVENLWPFLERVGLPEPVGIETLPRQFALHDSCAARHDAGLQESVRNIAKKIRAQIEELPLNRDHTTCCGYGGLMLYANRELAHKVINRRITEAAPDYLVYCSMCRDNFAGQGKKTYHLLDLIFGGKPEQSGAPGPGYSERQANRAKLKNSLLREIWGETVAEEDITLEIIIPETVKQLMEDRMILADEVAKVISHAENTNSKMQLTENGNYIAYLQIEAVTYWVEYSAREETFVVHNAYCHRISITG